MAADELFDDEDEALALCSKALKYLARYRDSHDGLFPIDIFNALIRLRPSASAEVIVHRMVGDQVEFWLTLRAVDENDPFNGMWHYTGSLERNDDAMVGAIRRVVTHELGHRVEGLTSIEQVGSIHPLHSRRADVHCVLFLTTLDGEPASSEEGRWFSADEAAHLMPLRKGRDGIVPSHLVGLALCMRHLGRPFTSPWLAPSPLGYLVTNDEGYRQHIVHIDAIDPEAVRFEPGVWLKADDGDTKNDSA